LTNVFERERLRVSLSANKSGRREVMKVIGKAQVRCVARRDDAGPKCEAQGAAGLRTLGKADAVGGAIEASGRHDDWIAEFKEKYGLCPEMGI
jgi:hypothetical protein